MSSNGRGANVAACAAGSTRIGLGCMALTGTYGAVELDVAQATIHTALDLGVRLFDTAALYADGANEDLLGRTIGHRKDVFVVTKFGLSKSIDGTLVRDSSPAAMRASVDASLRRLRRNQVDLLLQHRPDPHTNGELVAEVAADLIREGKIAAFGLSGSTTIHLKEFKRIVPVVAIQNELSLVSLERREEVAVLDQAGAMFMAYAPLGRGLLTGRLGQISTVDDLRAGMPQFQSVAGNTNLDRLKAVDQVAGHRATSRAAIALAWALQVGANVVPIPGARSPDQIKTAIVAAELILSRDELQFLSAGR